MKRAYYSQRTGSNPNPNGLPLLDIVQLFVRVYDQLRSDGYFDEAFGFSCVDAGDIQGRVPDVDLEILLAVHKKNLWPIAECSEEYSEDDLFDLIEFLFQHVSKPIDGHNHTWGECGMHWETFNQQDGQEYYRGRMNEVLAHYESGFELSPDGEVLHRAEAGFESIFDADVPSEDTNVVSRINAAVLAYRRHGSTVEQRRQAVRALAGC